MDYPLEFRKFISSQYLYTGIRITAGVIIPAVLLYEYEVLPTLIGIPLGALFVSLTDNPGPPQHRRNGILISILLTFIVVLITGYSRFSPVLIAIETVVFGLLFSLIGVFGNRANAIGLVALIVFILQVDEHQGAQHILLQGLFFVTGGLWYALLSFMLQTIQPYRAIQQLLGECLMEMADYFHSRARFYLRNQNTSDIYSDLFEKQVRINHLEEELREVLFSTRRFVSESTHKGRVLMMIFLDSFDLLERIMTAQQNYDQLHQEFDSSGILNQFYKNIKILANTLHHIGLTLQAGNTYTQGADLEAQYQISAEAFADLRAKNLNSSNVESFITLRHILYSLQDLTERIRRIEYYTTLDKKSSNDLSVEIDINKLKTTSQIDFNLFKSNISLKSATFRHAIRVSVALLAGYIISLLFPIGHGYWILLTIATIIKPAYSLSKSRNIQRLLGTLAGAVLGFGILFTSPGETVLFVTMVMSMILAYSLLRVNYGVSIAGLTTFLLISFYFLNPQGMQEVLIDRIVDTVIGCVLAYLVSILVLPSWEHEQIDMMMDKAIESNRDYFQVIATSFISEPADVTTLKIRRKDSFVALANLSDTFQRMLSEPKSQTKYLQYYHQFVTSNHVLTSYLASLSYYAEKVAALYRSSDFQPMIKTIERQFEKALKARQNPALIEEFDKNPLPINKRVQQLLEARKQELKGNVANEPVTRKLLSDLKAITEQFRLIYSSIGDQVKILGELKS